jgi:hypothetical protein
MSDYNPDPRRPDLQRPDLYGAQNRFQYTEDVGGRSNYAFIALLAIVALVGGVLFFAKPHPADQQAQVPPPTVTAPIGQPAAPAIPATPARPTEPAAPRE